MKKSQKQDIDFGKYVLLTFLGLTQKTSQTVITTEVQMSDDKPPCVYGGSRRSDLYPCSLRLLWFDFPLPVRKS